MVANGPPKWISQTQHIGRSKFGVPQNHSKSTKLLHSNSRWSQHYRSGKRFCFFFGSWDRHIPSPTDIFFACHCPLARARVERTAASKLGSKVQFGGQSRMKVPCWWIRGTFPQICFHMFPHTHDQSWHPLLAKLGVLILFTSGSEVLPRSASAGGSIEWPQIWRSCRPYGGTTPGGCSFSVDCHQVSLSKWVSAIMRWTKVNSQCHKPSPIEVCYWVYHGLPWFT